MATDTPGTKPDNQTDTKSDDEPLGEPGKKALEAERRARREAEKRHQELEAKVAAMERAELVREVAADKGVPADLLTGEDRDDLEAAADRLLDFKGGNVQGSKSPPKEKLHGGASDPDDQPQDYSKVADSILR